MFIKKDLRKIEEILSDNKDKKEILKLSKRYDFFLCVSLIYNVICDFLFFM